MQGTIDDLGSESDILQNPMQTSTTNTSTRCEGFNAASKTVSLCVSNVVCGIGADSGVHDVQKRSTFCPKGTLARLKL